MILIINRFREEFGEEILASEVRTRTEGVTKPMERKSVWVTLHRRIFHRAVDLPEQVRCPAYMHPHGIEGIRRSYGDYLSLHYLRGNGELHGTSGGVLRPWFRLTIYGYVR